MENNELWTLTMVFRDATGKKEVTETLSFPSLQEAEAAIASFKADPDQRTGKVFKISNPQGEYIEFRGQNWIRHSVKRDSTGIF